jgi:hypothetical protein
METKVFDGKTYHYYRTANTPQNAKGAAEGIRADGYFVRLVVRKGKSQGMHWYRADIYRRKK